MNPVQEAQAQRFTILRNELEKELKIHLIDGRRRIERAQSRQRARLRLLSVELDRTSRSAPCKSDRLRAIARALELVATMRPAVPPVEGSP